ncbi:hypothetical protein CEXT_233341 [Caerostris extrusa]|uniref:Uncharacterized protein n=1 Tax=Caerostris extrusa TaxID=172846 RepID=A0AAV4WPR3_CAEEX|nr:hypothetical protein CEXT_233341 [Caerostris extrusa]
MHGRVYTYTFTFSEIASHQKKRIMPGEDIFFFVSVRLLRANLYVVLTYPRHVLFPKSHLVSNLRGIPNGISIPSSDAIIALRVVLFPRACPGLGKRDLHHDFFHLLAAFSTIDSERENNVSRSPNWK